MQRIIKQPLNKEIILKTAVIFLVSYLISLLLWIQVKDIYSYGVINIAARLVSLTKEVEFEELAQMGTDVIRATFRPLRHNAGLVIDIPVKTSSYTFNVPLTFGIMAALFPFVKRRAYIEGLLLLFATHLLTIYFSETAQLTMALVGKSFDSVGKIRMAVYQFLWVFSEEMVIKFVPFLIGFYMFIRFRK
ncbi:MAG: hypothetical protein HZC48_00185 [Nitrospirae bacterium]|nr:hypothetical protein [Nitrospirota bacterium]